MQEEDATASLASDDVGECVRVRHECLDEFLLIGSQYQLIEGSIIEYYITLLREEDLITRMLFHWKYITSSWTPLIRPT